MTKAEARKKAKGRIAELSDAEREWAGGAIVDALTSCEEFRRARSVFIFMSVESEPDTEPLIGLALGMEKTVSVPVIDGLNMKAVIITPYTDFGKNRFGIPEPSKGHEAVETELAIVPLVAFNGLNRLGHGGGYYDRFLASHTCKKIGIGFSCLEISDLPIEETDVQMDMIVTEKEIIRVGGREINRFGGGLCE